MADSFDEAVNLFMSQILALANTLPMFELTARVMRDARAKEFRDYLKTHGELIKEEEGIEKYKYPIEHVHRVSRLRNKNNQAEHARDLLLRSTLASFVSQFDAYMGNILKVMFTVKPQMLNATDKSVSFSDLSGFDTVEQIREYISEKEVETVLRKSHTEHFKYLENKLSIPLTKNLDAWSPFVEITERRNVFAHNDAKVSSQYLRVCSSNGVKEIDQKSVGDELKVEHDYFKKSYRCLLEIGIKLGQVVWRKVLPDQIEKANDHLIDLSYQLLIEKEYDVHIAIMKLAEEKFTKNAPQIVKLTLAVNNIQAYKWKGEEEKVQQLENSIDWSAVGDEFKLARAVLVDDFDTAARYMERVTLEGTEESKQIRRGDFEEWPLFKRFRKSEQFQKKFAELFGEPEESIQLETESHTKKYSDISDSDDMDQPIPEIDSSLKN